MFLIQLDKRRRCLLLMQPWFLLPENIWQGISLWFFKPCTLPIELPCTLPIALPCTLPIALPCVLPVALSCRLPIALLLSLPPSELREKIGYLVVVLNFNYVTQKKCFVLAKDYLSVLQNYISRMFKVLAKWWDRPSHFCCYQYCEQ